MFVKSESLLVVALCMCARAAVVSQEPRSISSSANEPRLVSPMAKVISVIDKIIQEVIQEGKDEAAAYDKFACFCGNSTKALSDQADHYTNDMIEVLAADMGETKMEIENAKDMVETHKMKVEESSRGLQDLEELKKEENAKWQTIAAKWDSNEHLMQNAMDALRAAKDKVHSIPSGRRPNDAFLQLPVDMQPAIKELVAEANAMGLIKSDKMKIVATSLLQAGSTGPIDGEYKYHRQSNEILNLVQSLFNDMENVYRQQEADHRDAVMSYDDQIRKTVDIRDTSQQQILDSQQSVNENKSLLGRLREKMINHKASLEDTQDLLKDLTKKCEFRAGEFDERARTRKDELQALNSAVALLSGASSAAAAQDRALLQTQEPAQHKDTSTHKVITSTESAASKKLSFLQEFLAKSQAPPSFLQRTGVSLEDRKKQALALLSNEGQRLHSLMITSLATGSAGDPFGKVKDLIEKLIGRLQQEAISETTKTEYCGTEMKKAETERDMRFESAKKLNTEIRSLEAQLDALKFSAGRNGKRDREIDKSLQSVKKDFAEFKERNEKAVKTQKEAMAQVQEAIGILKSYYSQAAKADAASLLQQPVRSISKQERQRNEIRDDDRLYDAGLGTVPAAARQGGMKSVFGLLQTVASDFDREIRSLEEAMEQEKENYVDTVSTLEEKSKNVGESGSMDKQDAESTELAIQTKTDELRTAMNLLGSALQKLEELRPSCVDSGMSYKERVQKREDEIKALQKACKILGGGKKECE